MKVGIVGAGRLGSAVSERLLQQGFSVGAWNRTPDKLGDLVGKGLIAYPTPRGLAAASDCVLILITDLEASRVVYAGSGGLLEAKGERLFVELSTLAPAAHIELSERVRGAGSKYLECPVVGSRDAALSGTLIGLAAGDPADLERARPVLGAICRRIDHIGDIGAAAIVKLALNLPLLVYFEVMSEALRLVDHLKLDPNLMIGLLAESSGGPNFLRIMGARIAEALAGDAPPPAQNSVALFTKDLALILAEARARGLRLPVTDASLVEYRKVETNNPGDIDGMRLPALLLDAARVARDQRTS